MKSERGQGLGKQRKVGCSEKVKENSRKIMEKKGRGNKKCLNFDKH